MKFGIFLVLWFAATAASPASAVQFTNQGYLRGPVGMNPSGGRQLLLNNPGSRGNEFRLGNESAYAEDWFTIHFLPSSVATDPSFDTTISFAYNQGMNTVYGDPPRAGDVLSIVQMYVRGGNLDDVPVSYWAGKRFYREFYDSMSDFFYFADMSGNGGGIEDWRLGNGTLAIALLEYTDTAVTMSTNGNPSKQALDLRWRDIRLGEKDRATLWLAEGYTAPGTGYRASPGNTQTPVDYQAANGTAAGILWRHSVGRGNNDFAVLYGTGVMQSLTLNDTAYVPTGSLLTKATRWRFVDNLVSELGSRWSIETSVVEEIADSGAQDKSHSEWTSLGVRPMYYISDHLHVFVEVGTSTVVDETEHYADGSGVGRRILNRVTFGPEIGIGRDYFTRPVIRAYVTYTSWNQANLAQGVATNSLIQNFDATKMTSLDGKTNLTQFGFEGEAWF